MSQTGETLPQRITRLCNAADFPPAFAAWCIAHINPEFAAVHTQLDDHQIFRRIAAQYCFGWLLAQALEPLTQLDPNRE